MDSGLSVTDSRVISGPGSYRPVFPWPPPFGLSVPPTPYITTARTADTSITGRRPISYVFLSAPPCQKWLHRIAVAHTLMSVFFRG